MIMVMTVTMTIAKAAIMKTTEDIYLTVSRSASRDMPMTAEAISAVR